MDKKSWDIVWETPRQDGLYSLNLSGSNHCTALTSATANPGKSFAMEWHGRTGHLGVNRYLKLSDYFPSVPYFERSILEGLQCVPCIQGKARRSPVLPSSFETHNPLELTHVDISGPVTAPTVAGNRYTIALLDDYTAQSDVFMLKTKDETYHTLEWYLNRSQTEFNDQVKLRNIKLDRAGENKGEDVKAFAHKHGIKLNYSPAYASQSNGAAERLIQEHWTRARVLLFAADLPMKLWGEAINHGNWIRNRAPSERIGGEIPILAWNPDTRVDFSKVPSFGQKGHAFIYRSKTTPQRKLLPRTAFGNFVGMESDITLFRVFVPSTERIIVTRAQDFHPLNSEALPGMSTLLDGISRELELEALDDASLPELGDMEGPERDNEEQLVSVLTAATVHEPCVFVSKKTLQDPSLPRSFSRACEDPLWAEAIDREFNALLERQTWELIPRTANMKPVPFTWVFRLKPLSEDGMFLHKARCCVRGDKQKPFIDYDPDSTYAPVATHETLRILLSFAASQNLELEGADISNAYLYGKLDIPIIMQQPTDSSQVEKKPGHVAQVNGSMYGTKQAGEIWGSLLQERLQSWNFRTSRYDARLYFLRKGDMFILVAIVVDDLSFASNSPSMMTWFKEKLAATFDVKLFGALSSFIGWQITRSPSGIKAHQRRYAQALLSSHGLDQANVVQTPLPQNADLLPAHPNEQVLSRQEHSQYRSSIGGLLYLAVCTRPDLSFPVSAMARHLHAPTRRHHSLVKRLLRYVAGTLDYGLHFPRTSTFDPSSLVACVDADWGGCHESRRSTTGFTIVVNGAPVYWRSKRQTVIALSSAESEYITLSSCAKEVSWLRKLFWEIAHASPWDEDNCFAETMVMMDSTAAQSLASNPHVSARNKHIDLKVHHVRALIQRNVICLFHVNSFEQPADLLTKIMSPQTLRQMIALLRLSKF